MPKLCGPANLTFLKRFDSKPRPPTLLDIARATGLALSTVSYALRKSKQVKPATAERVLAVANKMGYRPNYAAAELAAQRGGNFSRGQVVIAYIHDTDLPEKPELAIGMYNHWALINQAEGLGVNLLIEDARKYGSLQQLARVLYHRGVDGLLYELVHASKGGIHPMGEQLPVVVVNYRPGLHSVQYPQVRMDFGRSLRRCWREAVERGYKKIGAVTHAHSPPVYDDYTLLGAAHAAQAQYGGGKIPVCQTDHRDREGFLRWFNKHRPDAIVALNPMPFWWLKEEGVGIPEEVGLASIYLQTHGPDSNFSGLLPATHQIADIALRWIISLAKFSADLDARETRNILVQSAWNEGTTLPLLQ